MCTHFLTFIAGKINFHESADVTTADMASSMWFIFDMLIKSMAIKLEQEKLLGSVDQPTSIKCANIGFKQISQPCLSA